MRPKPKLLASSLRRFESTRASQCASWKACDSSCTCSKANRERTPTVRLRLMHLIGPRLLKEDKVGEVLGVVCTPHERGQYREWAGRRRRLHILQNQVRESWLLRASARLLGTTYAPPGRPCADSSSPEMGESLSNR